MAWSKWPALSACPVRASSLNRAAKASFPGIGACAGPTGLPLSQRNRRPLVPISARSSLGDGGGGGGVHVAQADAPCGGGCQGGGQNCRRRTAPPTRVCAPGRRRRLHPMGDRAWSRGAVALVLEVFGSRTLVKPMPQRHRASPDRPLRREARQLPLHYFLCPGNGGWVHPGVLFTRY